MSNEVLIPIGDIILRTAPFITFGIMFGWMIGSLRAELDNRIHRVEMASFDRMAQNLKMYGAIAERFQYCMMSDRFELVDVRKEENDKEPSESNSK